MSFLLPCPQCGPRDVYEFRWGGEQSERPRPGAGGDAWARYLYLRGNAAGAQQEWWYHRAGCRRWFLAVRDTRANRVERTFFPAAGGSAPFPSAPTPAPAPPPPPGQVEGPPA
jgi:sarcosine oxidase subunit delta